MRRSTKIWLMIATSLILIGCIIFLGVMAMLKWDFKKLSTDNYETNTHEINEAFHAISIHADTADIRFVPSEDSACKVVCYEQTNAKHSVAIRDDTLVIALDDSRKWYEYIGIHFRKPKITVYIPQGEYGALLVKSSTGDVEIPKEFQFESIDISQSTGDVTNYASASEFVKIETSTGDIRVENISAGALDLSVSTGEVTVRSITCEGDIQINVSTGRAKLADVTCKNIISNGDTGDISLKRVISAENITIERSTGDVTFDGCDAAEILVKTSTGSVKGSLLSDKVFIAESDTGHVVVPKTVTGGKCEVTTSTGDINISIQQ